MGKPKLQMVQTDMEAIKNIVNEAIKGTQVTPDVIKNIAEETTKNVLKEQKEITLKQEHVNKLLKKDTMLKDKREQEFKKVQEKTEKEHVHNKDSCPNCQSNVKNLGDGVHICEGENCGVAILDKAAKFVVCDDCESPIPESFVGTKKTCPRCGGTGAHYHNKPKK
ncbi:hypothetical protein KKF61_08240 [Patescibacteria group bacterium]|nr:hypothetical protein [Patescibacteria group bacterium]